MIIFSISRNPVLYTRFSIIAITGLSSFVLEETGVDGDQDTAGKRYTKVRFEHRRNIRAEDSHPVKVLKTRIPEGGGE